MSESAARYIVDKQKLTESVAVVIYSKKLGIQLPQTVRAALGWDPGTKFSISKKGRGVVVKRLGDHEDAERVRQVGVSFYLPLELEMASRLDWDRGTALLMEATPDRIMLSEPVGTDFCRENLIESWLMVRLSQGQSTGEAMASLGEQVERRLSTRTLYKWRNGTLPSAEAINVMQSEVLRAVVGGEGIDAKNIDSVIAGISLVPPSQEPK